MDQKRNENISKFLSYVLRHHPQDINLTLDPQGWADIKELIENAHKYKAWELTQEDIEHVVKTNAKQRFALSEDGIRIRANQGHSIEVYLELPDVEPPEFLYHGTAKRFLDSIQKEGLKPMQRHDVHLSFDPKTALAVGQRHGSPVILKIHSKKMADNGFVFKCTKNNVWLTKHVPAEFFEII